MGKTIREFWDDMQLRRLWRQQILEQSMKPWSLKLETNQNAEEDATT